MTFYRPVKCEDSNETERTLQEEAHDDDSWDDEDVYAPQPLRPSTGSRLRFALFLGASLLALTVLTAQRILLKPLLAQEDDEGPRYANSTAPMPVKTQSIVYNGDSYAFTDLAIKQIESYKRGDGLIINIHITHHGGTTFCSVVGKAPGKHAPSAYCNHPHWEEDNITDDYPHEQPWHHGDTAHNLQVVRENGFHMVSWEFGSAPSIPLVETDWENPNIVSVWIAREPISRLLAHDGWVRDHFPGLLQGNGTHEDWMGYANARRTNNYALAILANDGCCQGEKTSREHLIAAQELVSRFTFVLDIACLGEGLEALAGVLGIELDESKFEKKGSDHHHVPASERIPFPDVYEYLVERNKLDIELYQWAKKISLVDCDALRS